jgi:hypothetical protein
MRFLIRISNRKETEFLRVEGGPSKQMAPYELSNEGKVTGNK